MMTDSSDIGLAFKDFSVSSLIPPRPILSNISGFVKKGGITAVFGASSSGKSLLLKSLSGRIQSLSISGKEFIDDIHVILPIILPMYRNSICLLVILLHVK